MSRSRRVWYASELECGAAMAGYNDGACRSTAIDCRRCRRSPCRRQTESPEPNPLRGDSAARARESQGWAAASPAADCWSTAVRAAVDARPGDRSCVEIGRPSGADRERPAQTILADARQRVRAAAGPHYRKVINATGIILHTALGRAVLPAKAMRQIADGTGRLLAAPGRHRDRRAVEARRADRVAPAAAHRRRGGHGGQQQRRRHVDRAQHGRPRPGGHRLARATGRDRRLVPPARRHGGQRREARRGGHDQQDARPRLRAGDHRRTRPPSSACIRATTRSPASPPRCRWRSWCGSATPAACR